MPLVSLPDLPVGTRRTKVLVVDDDEVTLKALSLRLQADGYEVSTASDASEAIGCVRRVRPDLIMLDVNFPPDIWNGGIPWNGFLILDWLRRLEETCKTPVIFITAGDLAPCHEKALRAGAAGLFQKPVRHKELLGVIEQAVASAKSLSPVGTSQQFGQAN